MLKSIAPRYAARIEFVTIDIDRHPEIKEEFNLRGVPALWLRKDDGTLVGPIEPQRASLLAILDTQAYLPVGAEDQKENEGCSRAVAFHGDAGLKIDIIEMARSGGFGLMADDGAEDVAHDQERISGIPATLLLSASMINGRESEGRTRAIRWLQVIQPGIDLKPVTSRLYEWLLEDLLRPPKLLPRRSAPLPLLEAILSLAHLHGLEARSNFHVDRLRWNQARSSLKKISAMESIAPGWRAVARGAASLASPARLLGDVLRTEVAGGIMMHFIGERIASDWKIETDRIDALRIAFDEFRRTAPCMSRNEAWESSAGMRYATELNLFLPKQEAIQQEIAELFRKRWHYGLMKVSVEARDSQRKI